MNFNKGGIIFFNLTFNCWNAQRMVGWVVAVGHILGESWFGVFLRDLVGWRAWWPRRVWCSTAAPIFLCSWVWLDTSYDLSVPLLPRDWVDKDWTNCWHSDCFTVSGAEWAGKLIISSVYPSWISSLHNLSRTLEMNSHSHSIHIHITCWTGLLPFLVLYKGPKNVLIL